MFKVLNPSKLNIETVELMNKFFQLLLVNCIDDGLGSC